MKDSMKALSALTDEELAVRYMNGDNDAFDLILKHNQSKLFTYIFYIVRDEEKANDFFQDTFIKQVLGMVYAYRPQCHHGSVS